MPDSVPVRCPACRRAHDFTPPAFPCRCGAPVVLPVLRGARPARVVRRSWKDSWVRLRCPSCGHSGDWPQPELLCPCGAVIRVPVDARAARQDQDRPRRAGSGAAGTRPPVPRPPFRPVAIRTGRDAVAAAARYLSWLGYQDVRPTTDRSGTGVDVRGRGLVAQVDPATGPTARRGIETLWINYPALKARPRS